MTSEASNLPDFERPPVIEVVIGVRFEELTRLSTADYASFWKLIEGEYPLLEDHELIGDPGESPSSASHVLEMPPLRRVFFVHSDKSYLMQLQPDRFLHNWRRLEDTDEYPHFEAARKRFEEGWTKFRQFVADRRLGELRANRYELTYINHIAAEPPDALPVAAEKYLPFLSWASWRAARAEGLLPDPASFQAGLRFSLPENRGGLAVAIKHGKRASDGREVMQLELTARGPAKPDTSDIDSWLRLAHEWIVRGFTDLTSRWAHERWGRKR